MAEVARRLKARAINPEEYGPEDWWAYEIEFASHRVLDLSDGKVLERLQVRTADLVADDLALTRRLGRQALDAGYEAIIVPSAAHEGGKNLVIFLGPASGVPSVKASAPVDLSQEGAS